MGQVRRFARAGFLAPERTPRNHYRFSFQDLTFLRTTTVLFASEMPRCRVHYALRALRRQQPADRPLSEIHLTVGPEDIVARDGEATWYPASGQLVLDFEAGDDGPAISPLVADFPDDDMPVIDELKSEEWFDRAFVLEGTRQAEARQAYRRALALNPTHTDARINLARLLHAAEQFDEAVEHYRIVLTAQPDHAIAAYNLGVVLEDMGREHDAFTAYAQAIAADPNCAEAHFNIAKLYEAAGDQLAALRHLRTYRELLK